MSDYKQYISDAKQAIDSKRYDEALDLLMMAISLEPNSMDALFLAGYASFFAERYDLAIDYLSRYIEKNPNNATAYFLLGSMYYSQRKSGKAIEYFDRAEMIGCDKEFQQKIYYLRGVLCQLELHQDDALVYLKKADEIGLYNTDRLDVLARIVQIYLQKGMLGKAEEYSRKLKGVYPTLYLSYKILFQILMLENKIEEAENVLDAAERESVMSVQEKAENVINRAAILCKKAEIKRDNNYYIDAIQILNELETMENLKQVIICESKIRIVEIFMTLGKYEMAIAVSKQVIDQASNEIRSLVDKARIDILECNLRRNDYSSAEKDAISLKKSENTFIRDYAYYIEAYCARQQMLSGKRRRSEVDRIYAQLIAFYKNAVIKDPSDYTAYLYRARAYVDMGQYERAREIGKILTKEGEVVLNNYIDERQSARRGG